MLIRFEKKLAKKTKKRSISSTAKSLAKNFRKLAVDVQRVVLSEMVAVYERAASTSRKTPKKAKKAKKVKKAKKTAKKQ